jgi:molybdopterin molybdotransferase
MPEFFNVLPPDEALAKFFEHLPSTPQSETLHIADALDRVTTETIRASVSIPSFPRSTMDGYAVNARDTFGASQTLPAYLNIIGEVPMGAAPSFDLKPTQAALVHTGGMIPTGADAVVMIEVTQHTRDNEIEVLKAVAPGENILQAGDDISEGNEVVSAGHILRAQDLGGLAALGITQIKVARKPRVALLATGDEIVAPESEMRLGQIRDVNSYSVAGQILRAGGIPARVGIAPDQFDQLKSKAAQALSECEALVVSAGSSVSVRDMTAEVIHQLGKPGMLVHGVAVKPGKPTILAVADGKPVIGLPGNPVSAMVCADLFVVPTIYRLLGCKTLPTNRSVNLRVTHNVSSQAGRVDYVPARIIKRDGEDWVEPIFGKSNQIFTLVFADGMIIIGRDSNGAQSGEAVEMRLF